MYSTIKNFSVSVNCGNVELSEILNTFSRTIQGLNERIEYLENELEEQKRNNKKKSILLRIK